MIFYSQDLFKKKPDLWVTSALLRNRDFQRGLGIAESGEEILKLFEKKIVQSQWRLSRWFLCVRVAYSLPKWRSVLPGHRALLLGIREEQPVPISPFKAMHSARSYFKIYQLLKRKQGKERTSVMKDGKTPSLEGVLSCVIQQFCWELHPRATVEVPYPFFRLAPKGSYFQAFLPIH